MFLFHDFPPHMQLLLLAARSPLSEAETRQIEDLASPLNAAPLDWPQFLAVTEHHRLAPLVFRSLDQIRPDGLPAYVFDRLQREARSNAFEALRATSELQGIVERFAAAEIPLTVIKGIALSQLLYGSPTLRHVGDLDLLTEPKRLPDQIALLADLGYRRINPWCRLTPHRLKSYVAFWKDFTFRNEDSKFELDLHWRLFNNRFHAANRILLDAKHTTISVFDTPMRTFSAQDQFLYVATHGVSDAWTYLKTLADVAAFLRLLQPSEIDHALQRADELGLLPQVSAAVHLANDWMNTNVQSPRLLSAEDNFAAKLRHRTTQSLLRHNFQPNRDHASPWEWLMLEMKLVPGVRSVFELLRRFVWRPRVWSRVDLPDELFWMYPVLSIFLLPRPPLGSD